MNRSIAVSALALASLAGVALGQPKADQTPPAKLPAVVSDAARSREAAREEASKIAWQTLVTIDFSGGTVIEYVEHVKHATKTPINVVVSPSVSGAVMSSVQLKEVPVDAAISAIQTACGQGTYSWRIRPMEGISGSGTIPNAFSVDGERRGPQFAGSDPSKGPRTVEVIALPTSEGGGVKPDVALSAVEAGLRVGQTKNSTPADVSFHKESGLLFVNGSPEQIDLVKQVLNAFRSRRTDAETSGWLQVLGEARASIGVTSPADFLRRFGELVADSKARMDAEHEAKLTISALQVTSDNLKHQLDQQRSQAVVEHRDLESKHQAEVADLRDQYKALEKKYRELMDQAAMLEAKAKAAQVNQPVDNTKR